jgi:hypothetical protein
VVYATVPGRAALTGGSVLVRTGGELFAGSLDYNAAARRVVSDISDYYLLGYTPEPSKRDLRSVSVVVARQGVRVHARERR